MSEQKKQLTISVLVTSKEFNNVYPGVECDEMDLHRFTESIAQSIREDLQSRKVTIHRTVDVEDLEDPTIAELKAKIKRMEDNLITDCEPCPFDVAATTLQDYTRKIEAELDLVQEKANGNHRACGRLAKENDALRTELLTHQWISVEEANHSIKYQCLFEKERVVMGHKNENDVWWDSDGRVMRQPDLIKPITLPPEKGGQ